MSELPNDERSTDLYRDLAWELTNSMSYPVDMIPHILGQDMSPLISAVYKGLKEKGYKKSEVVSPPDLM